MPTAEMSRVSTSHRLANAWKVQLSHRQLAGQLGAKIGGAVAPASRPSGSDQAQRAVFDRYNMVNEQEFLTAGQRLAAYLADEKPTHVRGAA